ncbi:MAG: FkbM family methyltransferase [Acidobacteria bacterium]|nr:FkbM family methyltransferase [Acidobacteriota bacterium]
MGTILRGMTRILVFAAAWALIPVALLVSLLLPFSTWIRLALILLPAILIASWLIKISLCGQLSRKASPFRFYIAVAAVVLFLITAAAFFKSGGLVSVEKTVRHIFQMKRSPAVGLMADPGRRYRLFLTGIKLDVLHGLPETGGVKILDYSVRGYLFSTIRFLYNEIFIDQPYYFPSDTPQPFIIDCGSHIGMSILYFKTLYPDAHVVGFEPAPGTFQLLSENIRQNGLKNVVLYKKAVGNREGKATFYGDDSVTSSLFEGRNPGGAYEVDIVKLSDYMDRPVNFLKLDVEGAESLVFEDLVAASKMRMIQYMTIEYHHHTEKNVDQLSGFLKMLEDNNFGYQLQTSPDPFRNESYQDVMIFAYRK